MGAADAGILGTVPRALRGGRLGVAHRGRAGARTRQRPEDRQAGVGAHRPLRAHSCRSARKDDADKPQFASLRPEQRMDAITLEDALELFKLPRDLGKTAEGEPIKANVGRFGPYVQYAKKCR